MRKLHQILPIVRNHLITVDHPETNELRDEFICIAAHIAHREFEIDREEFNAIKTYIVLNLKGWATLFTYLRSVDVCPAHIMDPIDPEFFPYRDAWLDKMQEILEFGNS